MRAEHHLQRLLRFLPITSIHKADGVLKLGSDWGLCPRTAPAN